MTVIKADLVRQIYQSHPELTKVRSTLAVELFLNLTKNSLVAGNNLLLSGFGKFKVKDKRLRRGRNRQTGEELMLTARRVVTFNPAGKLRGRVN